MISHKNKKPYKRINIEITTFKKSTPHKNQRTMTDSKKYKNNHASCNQASRFICSICLNRKCPKDDRNDIDTKGKTRSCPVCQRNVDTLVEIKYEKPKTSESESNANSKKVQTSQTNIPDGLHLLNEVLTVFQNKKVDEKKNYKDAAVTTDYSKISNVNLGISKVFSFSIKSEERFRDDTKFTIIDSHQPIVRIKSNINLTKHKSSSIPQMKMEELKKSLKDKTKSKDAIEEVNRMFATVRRIDNDNETNRPLVRSGPRVLPVVKTGNSNTQIERETPRQRKIESFKCCQTNNYHLSGGDSFHRCIYDSKQNNNDKFVYRMDYDRQRKKEPEIVVCECCGNRTEVKSGSFTSFV